MFFKVKLNFALYILKNQIKCFIVIYKKISILLHIKLYLSIINWYKYKMSKDKGKWQDIVETAKNCRVVWPKEEVDWYIVYSVYG